MLYTFENVASILAVECVLQGRGLQNKGEVAGVIFLLCIIHFVVVTVKMIKIGVYLRKLSRY